MDLRELKELFIDALKYIILIVIVLFTVNYVGTLQQVVGPSMEPNLYNNDIVVLNKLIYKIRNPKRFEVITFQYDNNQYLIKRIIGMPGESVFYKDNKLYINNLLYEEAFISNVVTNDFKINEFGYDTIPDDMYLVLGDNREDSVDSRNFGFISKKDIVGNPILRIFPFNKIRLLNNLY